MGGLTFKAKRLVLQCINGKFESRREEKIVCNLNITKCNINVRCGDLNNTNGYNLGLCLWCLTPLSTIFSYILVVSFIGGGNGVPGENHRPVASY